MLIYTLVRFCTVMFIFSMSFCVHASGLALAMKMAAVERAEEERLRLAHRATVAVVVQNPLAVPEERLGDLPRVDSIEMVSYAQGAQHPVNILSLDGPDHLEVVSVDSSDWDPEMVRSSSMQGRRGCTPLRLRRAVECQTDQQPSLDPSDDNCCSCRCCCFTLVARWFSSK